ncbi:MAG: PHP domain-containing protein, partial [Gemmatimonadales bacterium]
MKQSESPAENTDIARVLREVADLIEIGNGSTFRVRAYRNAARTVEELPESVAALVARGEAKSLGELPGIGKDLAGKIAGIARTGTLPLLRELSASVPRGAAALMRVRGIGPHRARALAADFNVHSVAQLERVARAGGLRGARGFGARTEAAILRELSAHREVEHRVLRPEAVAQGDAVARYLRGTPDVLRVELAGSLRRGRDTVGDVDVLVVAAPGTPVVDRFVRYPGVGEVLERGPTRASVRLRSGLQVDLRLVEERSFGAALYYFTGSKAHNVAVRALARRRGLKINEYGVWRGTRWTAGRDEKDIFRAVGLPWIPPELREARGELEAAANGKLPKLVSPADILGDLHTHTTDSDGRDSLEAMARAAEALGHEYLAVTDHSPAVRVTGGLDATGFRRQWKRIDKLNARLRTLTVLKGAEVDINADGSLDLDDATLAGFDVVLASVHSHFDLSRSAQTARMLRAISHPQVHVIAHPTGRLIGRRRPIELN